MLEAGWSSTFGPCSPHPPTPRTIPAMAPASPVTPRPLEGARSLRSLPRRTPAPGNSRACRRRRSRSARTVARSRTFPAHTGSGIRTCQHRTVGCNVGSCTARPRDSRRPRCRPARISTREVPRCSPGCVLVRTRNRPAEARPRLLGRHPRTNNRRSGSVPGTTSHRHTGPSKCSRTRGGIAPCRPPLTHADARWAVFVGGADHRRRMTVRARGEYDREQNSTPSGNGAAPERLCAHKTVWRADHVLQPGSVEYSRTQSPTALHLSLMVHSSTAVHGLPTGSGVSDHGLPG
jgi:hypothetical protein